MLLDFTCLSRHINNVNGSLCINPDDLLTRIFRGTTDPPLWNTGILSSGALTYTDFPPKYFSAVIISYHICKMWNTE